MKKIKSIIVVALVLFTGVLSAQEKEIDLFAIPLSNPGQAGKLELNQISGSISVTGYEGKEVIVKVAVAEDGKSSNKEKNGMKRVGGSGLNISAEEKNNVVRINNEMWSNETDFDIKVPYNFSLKLSTVNNGDISVLGVSGDLEISNVNGGISLQNVEGAVSANTTNGPVKVDFKRMGNMTDMAFSSFNGNVEVTFPNAIKASVKAKSDMGDVYTDFDMDISENKPLVDKKQTSGSYKVKLEQWVKGKINGGGPELLFKTFNGDIMIKSK
ncbi:hypothetical protein D2V93_16930 [Flagellimonas taeanensis]|uniref:DUF4097 family beta strand repeat-containing protein n=1 Tax=Flavobacteriaceae TaxID=49546 RepID=UPI000E69AD99|nr:MULTISPECIES: DUF4097 family beta strand repeat-containing protein [Allomuricauda]MDC6384074.1 DUF4097 family beta strand repeat-containing protein [Muricauda sp. SK9]RIV48680.1 hypothetical protein D2V93_16930 [Allomuricauda taeanensis]